MVYLVLLVLFFLQEVHPNDIKWPSSYVTGRLSSNEDIVLRIINRVESPGHCDNVEIVNSPTDPSLSPLVGPYTFQLIPTIYNGKPCWYNGYEYLSFVKNNNEFGTWLIGNSPGEDSGYAFYKPPVEALTPIELDDSNRKNSVHNNNYWNWLIHNEWIEMRNVTVRCVDTAFYDQIDHSGSSIAANDLTDRYYYNVEYFYDNSVFETYLTPSNRINDNNFYLWNEVTLDWITLKNVNLLFKVGEPCEVKFPDNTVKILHLINQEHSPEYGWSLTWQESPIKKFSETRFQQHTFRISNNGPTIGYNISAYKYDPSNYYTSYVPKIVVNDWIWLWYYNNDDTVITQEVLLHCIHSSSDVKIFKFYHSDRGVVLKQGVMSREGSFFVMNIKTREICDNYGNQIVIGGIWNLGNDIVDYIKYYLDFKEGSLGPDISSCFFYHAAVTLPASLVYAAEFVCVLIGSKPAVMIQYDSSSDEQWKFPLMNELTNNLMKIIIEHNVTSPNTYPLHYRTTYYKEAGTLIVYRKSREYLVDALRPFGNVVQALHPMPYPDNTSEDKLQKDYKEQIYNAWWNGYILGYPQRFIDSYCLDFHNPLSRDDKTIVIEQAKIDVKKYFNIINKQNVVIKSGLDPMVKEINKSKFPQEYSKYFIF